MPLSANSRSAKLRLAAAMNEELEKLARLLDDDDDDVAINVIAALLEREDELGDLPARLQESPDPLTRKRAHQLQAAMLFRQRRRKFAAGLQQKHPDFISGLVDLHLLWFDRDSQPAIEEELHKFISDIRRHPPVNLEEARALMYKLGFAAELESTIHPENYCIGTVLYQRSGAGSLLMGLLRELMAEPEKFQIVRFCGEFALFDRQNTILAGQGDWRVCRLSSTADLEEISVRDLLHLCGNMLFSSAVNSDSFRYVLTIAQALSGDSGDAVLDFLPYPYGPAAADRQQQ